MRLNKELAAWLEEMSSKTGVSQGQIIRQELEKAKTSGGGRSVLRLAGAARGPKNLSTRKGFS